MDDRLGKMQGIFKDYSAMTAAGNAVAGFLQKDETWLRMESPWQKSLQAYSGFSMDSVTGQRFLGSLSNLCRIEQETASALEAVMSPLKGMTSAMSQLESVYSVFDQLVKPIQRIAEPVRLLDTYEKFAWKQNKEIQKAASIVDEQTVKWRLDVLASTSKYIDRQVEWTGDFLTEIQEDLDIDKILETENTIDLPPIAQHVGYSKRDDIPVEEAFENSSIMAISEKGKQIACKTVDIKRGCKEKGLPVLFADTEKLVEKYMLLGMKFSNDAESFLEVRDALYDIFVTQKEMIQGFLPKEDCACISHIESLREEENPEKRSREFTRLQEMLYDDILALENKLLDAIGALQGTEPAGGSGMESRASAEMQNEAVGAGLVQEELISKHIYRALQRMLLVKGIIDRKENELNDWLRDLLSMVFEIKDQTRQGQSESGKDAGEIDIEICQEGEPIAILEGLVLQGVNKNSIDRHICKTLVNYDPLGCPMAYMILYYKGENFPEFWNRFGEYIGGEQNFPYEVMQRWEEIGCIHTSLRRAKSVLKRDGRNVSVYYYAMKVR